MTPQDLLDELRDTFYHIIASSNEVEIRGLAEWAIEKMDAEKDSQEQEPVAYFIKFSKEKGRIPEWQQVLHPIKEAAYYKEHDLPTDSLVPLYLRPANIITPQLDLERKRFWDWIKTTDLSPYSWEALARASWQAAQEKDKE